MHSRKANGIKLGRPKGSGKSKLDPYKDDILKLLEKILKKYVNYENNIFKNKTIYYGLLYDKAILIK